MREKTDGPRAFESYPAAVRAEAIVGKVPEVSESRDGRTWHPARAAGYPTLASRFRLAWAVFTGRADALFWPDGQ